ncbi:pacifastin-like protease inhibitor cvp4 [Fopius arisanus]|uniref:Cvp4 protein n=1 Tax=Fopius arisanus TaxID=64838 RepID=A0A0C9QZF4_9HYME|nr:PREDICTED: pacifastin-like protease inhibitor cvp4 [Fopius arisanus]
MMYKLIIFAVAITAIAAANHDPSTTKCEPKKIFSYYCNQCVCNADGEGAACTRQACPPGLFNEDGSMRVPPAPREKREISELPADGSCVVGRQYTSACNTCRCIRDNVPICTLKACPPELR